MAFQEKITQKVTLIIIRSQSNIAAMQNTWHDFWILDQFCGDKPYDIDKSSLLIQAGYFLFRNFANKVLVKTLGNCSKHDRATNSIFTDATTNSANCWNTDPEA